MHEDDDAPIEGHIAVSPAHVFDQQHCKGTC